MASFLLASYICFPIRGDTITLNRTFIVDSHAAAPELVDFGYILDPSKDLTAQFDILNPTDRPVTVKSLTTTCGCTNVWVDNKIIPPKSRIKLYSDIKTLVRSGIFNAKAIVQFSDSALAPLVISFKGKVGDDIKVIPPDGCFSDSDQLVFTVYADETLSPIQTVTPKLSSSNYSISWSQKTESTARSGQIRIIEFKLKPIGSTVPDKSFTARISFQYVDDKLNTSLLYPIKIGASSSLVISPALIVCRKGQTAKFLVNGALNKPDRLTTNSKFITLSVRQVGKDFWMGQVTCSNDAAPAQYNISDTEATVPAGPLAEINVQ